MLTYNKVVPIGIDKASTVKLRRVSAIDKFGRKLSRRKIRIAIHIEAFCTHVYTLFLIWMYVYIM